MKRIHIYGCFFIGRSLTNFVAPEYTVLYGKDPFMYIIVHFCKLLLDIYKGYCKWRNIKPPLFRKVS
jgi:hypothetical protein